MVIQPPLPIDHAKIVDGFAQLAQHQVYHAFETFCGICDEPITLSPQEQKYLLEVKGVPVKFLQRGAAFCQPCAKRRSRINCIKSGDKWRDSPELTAALESLRDAEASAKQHSGERYLTATWPYGAA